MIAFSFSNLFSQSEHPTRQDFETARAAALLGFENSIAGKHKLALEWFKDAEVLYDSLNIPLNEDQISMLHQEKGYAYENLNDYKNALREYKQAYETVPENLIHQHNYAYGLALNDTALYEALAIANNVIKQFPSLYSAYHSKGFIFLKLGRTNEAIREFEKALSGCTEEKHRQMYLEALKNARNKLK